MPDWTDQLVTDSLMDMLENRIVRLEEVAAARWPRRLLLARRLRRELRASVRYVPGDTFTDRRGEAVGSEWGAAEGRRT